jgi:hypothetical protein
MHFSTKNTLKNNHNYTHTPKHVLKTNTNVKLVSHCDLIILEKGENN